MAEARADRHRHFILEGVTETEAYRRPGGGGQRISVPEQDRTKHGGALLGQIGECQDAADAAREVQQSVGFEEGLGLQVEFESFPDVELAFESLARERQGIELLNVRHGETRTLATGTDPHHHAYLTVEAVSRPEVTAPSRLRVFGMAVTARDNRDRGRPSAWSAAVDSEAADLDEYGANPRLIVVSAGNVTDPKTWSLYPDSNDTDGVHDPAQAWERRHPSAPIQTSCRLPIRMRASIRQLPRLEH